MTATTAEDTIAAIATPPGPGGIGIIRISGSLAAEILKQLFSPRHPRESFTSHQMYYGWIVDPDDRSPIDEVLAVFMRAPATYTTEDVVEIHCHSSYLILEKILEHIFAAGARPAQPGEFTKRAFLNGRIDLTRAEAVLEVLQAKTGEGLALVTAQLKGRLHDKVIAIRDALLGVRALLEVAIDFPEDEVDILDHEEIRARLQEEVVEPLKKMIAAADQGKIFREGISAVIIGRPNVGKSSLLNTLLKEERALVTPVPGTTRDTIEEYINIRGMPVRIVDTAGIRDTRETVEEMGIQRARAKAAEADLVLLLLDATGMPTDEDRQLYRSVIENNQGEKILLVLNKMDLAPSIDPRLYADALGNEPIAAVSAKTNQGIDELENKIFSIITGGSGMWDPGMDLAPNLRHKNAMAMALEACRRGRQGLGLAVSPDLLAIDLQDALDHLGDIVGDTTTEDVLDLIFEQFCIGK